METYTQKLVSAGQFVLMSVLYYTEVIGYPWFVVSAAVFLASTAYTGRSDYKAYKAYKAHKQLKSKNSAGNDHEV